MKLPAKTTSFKRWAEQLQTYAQSDDLKAEADYWLKAIAADASPLPVDHTMGANTVSGARHAKTRYEPSIPALRSCCLGRE